ncbi:hypothetical protein BD410DRAFT_793862 [Rickenella mellea]|uniref:Uncharacterized protein n=1 Tax=Rickenella mellea TaxID=50990 RepID=A0A4Y7PTE7_9AGAM|nr:hypothetical protein BD410DRAFT_793862 [Rickenella mellea]
MSKAREDELGTNPPEDNTPHILQDLISNTSAGVLTALVAWIANEAGLSSTDIALARAEVAADLTRAKWTEAGPQLGFNEDPLAVELKVYSPLYCFLPSIVHREIFVRAWHALDAFEESFLHHEDDIGFRLLDIYIIPTIAPFGGRVVDRPRVSVQRNSNDFSVGDGVEHQIVASGRIIVIIMRAEHEEKEGQFLARAFLSLLAAHKQNDKEMGSQCRIHAVVSDMFHFHFYSYEPSTNKFCVDVQIVVGSKRENNLLDMIDVTNKLFSAIFDGYYEVIKSMSKSGNKGKGSFCGRRPAPEWEDAFRHAEQCRKSFQGHGGSISKTDQKSRDALKHLAESVRCHPCYSRTTAKVDVPAPDRLSGLARCTVEEWYTSRVQQNGSTLTANN